MTTPTTQALYVVELPVGVQDIGIEFQGSPPAIFSVRKDSPVQDRVQVGHYCHGLLMPDVEIVQITLVSHLNELLRVNAGTTRQLLFSRSPVYVDFVNSNNNSMRRQVVEVLYKHTLPQAKHLGFLMQGFPPVISAVDQDSLLFQKLHPHQTVEALVIPGQAIFNLAAGAFTSAKLQEKLIETAHISGRQLVVKDGANPTPFCGSSDPFDFGGMRLTNRRRWRLGFGVSKKW
jgi:hypothetical protein